MGIATDTTRRAGVSWMNMLIMGPQASGKGTQASIIAKRLGIPHLASGDMFRNELRSESELGQKLKQKIDAGILIDDETTWELVKANLEKHPEGWILDGFPRTPKQAEMLDNYGVPNRVVALKVPDEICVERIAGRRICKICGHDYHIKYKPPKVEGKCDLDDGQLVQRDDDNEDAVRNRLLQYHELTAPLLKHYRDVLVVINGNQGIEDVRKEIEEKLEL